MRLAIRPLYVFFAGMLFGAGALFFLTDVRWPKAEPVLAKLALPEPDLPAPALAEPPLPENAASRIEPPSAAPAPIAAKVPIPDAAPILPDIAAIVIPASSKAAAQQSSPLANLLIPVLGISAAQLSDTYTQARANGRVHEAIDILSPTGTPVLAVGDGRIVKLFDSKPGGLTLYQFDASETYAYYYAHLSGYAPGIIEGAQVVRGELIGYVGSTGNANPAAPHLHFAIFELGAQKNWWQGTPINPYPLLVSEQTAQ